MTDEANDEFEGIPNMPSAETVRAELMRTVDPSYWRPHGKPDGTPTDFSAVKPELAYAAIEARIKVGPGPHGNAFQWALWRHHEDVAKLEAERDGLLERISEVRYNAQTGEPSPILSADEREKLSIRLAAVGGELARKQGEPGKAALDRKLDAAVQEERRKYAEVYMLREAEKRAAAKAMEDRINELAETVFKKGAAKLETRR